MTRREFFKVCGLGAIGAAIVGAAKGKSEPDISELKRLTTGEPIMAYVKLDLRDTAGSGAAYIDIPVIPLQPMDTKNAIEASNRASRL